MFNDLKQSINNSTIGEGTYVADFVNIYGCTIGRECKIGTFVEIQSGVCIGDRCKVSSHSFICSGVKIGNGVFIGHGVKFINDRFPKAINEDGSLKSASDWDMECTEIGDGASIGTGSVIMCGIRIGAGALVGAGSVVTHDVAPGCVVYGNPAKVHSEEIE